MACSFMAKFKSAETFYTLLHKKNSMHGGNLQHGYRWSHKSTSFSAWNFSIKLFVNGYRFYHMRNGVVINFWLHITFEWLGWGLIFLQCIKFTIQICDHKTQRHPKPIEWSSDVEEIHPICQNSRVYNWTRRSSRHNNYGSLLDCCPLYPGN